MALYDYKKNNYRFGDFDALKMLFKGSTIDEINSRLMRDKNGRYMQQYLNKNKDVKAFNNKINKVKKISIADLKNKVSISDSHNDICKFNNTNALAIVDSSSNIMAYAIYYEKNHNIDFVYKLVDTSFGNSSEIDYFIKYIFEYFMEDVKKSDARKHIGFELDAGERFKYDKTASEGISEEDFKNITNDILKIANGLNSRISGIKNTKVDSNVKNSIDQSIRDFKNGKRTKIAIQWDIAYSGEVEDSNHTEFSNSEESLKNYISKYFSNLGFDVTDGNSYLYIENSTKYPYIKAYYENEYEYGEIHISIESIKNFEKAKNIFESVNII